MTAGDSGPSGGRGRGGIGNLALNNPFAGASPASPDAVQRPETTNDPIPGYGATRRSFSANLQKKGVLNLSTDFEKNLSTTAPNFYKTKPFRTRAAQLQRVCSVPVISPNIQEKNLWRIKTLVAERQHWPHW